MNLKNILFKAKNNIRRNYKVLIFQFISILIILMIIVQLFWLINNYTKKLIFKILIINNLAFFIAIISINIYSIRSIKTVLKLETKNKQLNEQNDKVRCFKHDFVNIIQSIGGYISIKDMDSLQMYFKSLSSECSLLNTLETMNNKGKENPAISSVLINKYKKASQKNINMNVSVLTNLSIVKGKSYMLSRMLGVLLDNAIEACTESKDKVINVIIENEKNGNKTLIKIENTYYEKKINFVKIYEKEYSTKKKNTGLGLWKVKDFINKYRNISLYTFRDENMFKQQLEIYE